MEETDAMIAPLKGTWTTDTYMGYALPYNLRKFEPDTYADEEAREMCIRDRCKEVVLLVGLLSELLLMRIPLRYRSGKNAVTFVSFYYLDVYKRQSLYFFPDG